MLEERKTKFKPIIKEELEQFSHKVDQIVQYLTIKRQEKRIEENKIGLNLKNLRTDTYEQTMVKDMEQRVEKHQEKHGK